MSRPSKLTANGAVLAVSTAGGGLARHFRVQYQIDSLPGWHMYSAFRNRNLAEQCVASLRASGYRARLVAYNISPAAA